MPLVELIARRAQLHPERAALVYREQRVTYGELWRRIQAAADILSASGVRPRDRVMLAAPSTPAFAYGYFAIHLLGATAVPVAPNVPDSRRDEFIARTRPALFIGASGSSTAVPQCRAIAIEELSAVAAPRGSSRLPARHALADVIFTTGTTGRPKGVRLTHENLLATVAHINAVIGTDERDVEVVPIPLNHSFGLGRLRCVLAAGACLVLVQGFRLPGEIFSALERHAATALVAVPAGFAVLLGFGERGLGKFGRQLRYVEIGSAAMPLDHKRALMALLPRTSLFMHYGLTEASRSAFIEFHHDEPGLESVGRAAPGVTIQIRDDQGNQVREGEQGLLWIRGPHVSPGYWDDPTLDRKTFAAGWLSTGDVARIAKDGYVYLHGRRDDMINIGGYSVAPDEVERVLTEHPAISEAACVGVPDPRGITGQVLRAFLVPAKEQAVASPAELSRWTAQRLENYKIPSEYHWIAELPKTSSGKLMRACLRAAAAEKDDGS